MHFLHTYLIHQSIYVCFLFCFYQLFNLHCWRFVFRWWILYIVNVIFATKAVSRHTILKTTTYYSYTFTKYSKVKIFIRYFKYTLCTSFKEFINIIFSILLHDYSVIGSTHYVNFFF